MAFFAVLGVTLVLALLGKRPNRASYVLVAVLAAAAAVYEYRQ